MPRFFKLLAKIQDENVETYYLFDKESRLLLPIGHGNRLSDAPISDKSNILETLCRLGKISIKGIRLYLYCDDTFYFHLQVEKDYRTYEISIAPKEALELATTLNKYIEVEDQIAQFCGIHITQELLEATRYTEESLAL